MGASHLHKNFTNELFKSCLRNRSVFELTMTHMKYTYLADEYQKSIWQAMVQYFQGSDKLLTIGLLSQMFINEPKVITIIGEIKEADEPDENTMIDQLEYYIKTKKVQEIAGSIQDLFNSGKVNELSDLLLPEITELSNFKIKDQSSYTRIISGFNEMYSETIQKTIDKPKISKIPFGIKCLDEASFGGPDRGDIVLVLADYAVGKSKALKHFGMTSMRYGNIVLHVQSEGSKEEAITGYQAAIAGKSFHDMEHGNLSQKELDEINTALQQIEDDMGEIFIQSFAQFDSGNMKDVYNYAQEIVDKFGRLDTIIIDYIDVMEPGDGKKYPANTEGDTRKRIACAEKLKNICLTFNCTGFTATQCKNTPSEKKNDPTFILTGEDIDRAKGLPRPFSYCISLNVTEDEKKNDIMRIGQFKWRKYKNVKKFYSIATNYDHERFYFNQRTISLFPEQ